MIVHTRTQEQWNFIINKNGAYCLKNDWPKYKEKSCYDIGSGFCDLDFYKSIKTIISFEDWLKESGNEKEWYSKFLKGKKIWIGDNPELSKRVQERLFGLGLSWAGYEFNNSKKFVTSDFYYKSIYINKEFEMYVHGGRDDEYSFHSDPYTEITLQDLGIEEKYPSGNTSAISGRGIIECVQPKFKVGDEVYVIEKDIIPDPFELDTKYEILAVKCNSVKIKENTARWWSDKSFEFWYNHPSHIKKQMLDDLITHGICVMPVQKISGGGGLTAQELEMYNKYKSIYEFDKHYDNVSDSRIDDCILTGKPPNEIKSIPVKKINLISKHKIINF